ncbi:hypothetical protein AAHH80_33770, partial [Burkholderia pseudomallei]
MWIIKFKVDLLFDERQYDEYEKEPEDSAALHEPHKQKHQTKIQHEKHKYIPHNQHQTQKDNPPNKKANTHQNHTDQLKATH